MMEPQERKEEVAPPSTNGSPARPHQKSEGAEGGELTSSARGQFMRRGRARSARVTSALRFFGMVWLGGGVVKVCTRGLLVPRKDASGRQPG